MRKFPLFHREREVAKMQRSLERHSFPRLQMSLLVGITGASGFAASYLLLHAGLLSMGPRYLAAFGVAYGVFLGLLWLWLRTKVQDYLDVADVADAADTFDLPGSWPSGTNVQLPMVHVHSSMDGNFGGGGANASFDSAAETVSDAASVAGKAMGNAVGDALDAASDADELAIPLMVLVLAVALVFSSLYMVYSAPALFAELAVDGLFTAGLYHKLRGLEPQHWLQTALRHTALPFALTAAVVSSVGWGLSQAAPGAHTLGQAIAQMH